MKKKLIFGLSMVVLLLFFITSSWALDYKNYLRQKCEGHPWEESDRVPVIPQAIDNSPSIIKFIFIPNTQLIFIDKVTTKASSKADDSAKNLTKGVKEQDE